MPRKEKIDDVQGHLNFAVPSTSERGHLASGRRATTCGVNHNLRKFGQRNANNDRLIENSKPKGELKGLQDSLSEYFTPNHIRRSRTITANMVDQPLEIMVDPTTNIRTHRTNSISSSKSGNSTVSPKSPHRRDRLEDALSLYFTPNPNKRRMHREGEYLNLSKGDDQSFSFRKSSSSEQNDAKEEEHMDGENRTENEESIGTEMPKAITTRLRLSTVNSQYLQKATHKNSIDDGKLMQKYIRKRESAAAIKSAQLVRRAHKGKRDSRKQIRFKTSQPVSSTFKACNVSSSLKNSIKNYFRPLKTTTLAPAIESVDADISTEIDKEDRTLFNEARQAIQRDLENANDTIKNDERKVFPSKIRINCYEIDTWYSSPYPQEYACLPVLHICDSCLMYLSIPESHFRKCKRIFPPGNEIYRDGSFSIFEVDGNLARVYCRNLCLLAKLFIDHKTLYFDVEPFLFYVMTLTDEFGCHFVGYFSKEKYSCQKYNLACIVTLPCYQGRGFGRFLIDFSYLLSKRENLIGSPERPLSELGRITYLSYWLSVVYEFFHQKILASKRTQISLSDLSHTTGISINDIVETLAENRLISSKDSTISIVLDENAIRTHWDHVKNSKKRIWLDEKNLKWAPKVYSPSKEFRLHSPALTPTSILNSPQKFDSINGTGKKPKKKIVKMKINMTNSNKTLDRQKSIASGTIGRKKPPTGKDNQEDSSDFESDANDDVEEKEKKRRFAKKNKVTCKESRERRVKRGEPSTDEDDERYSPEMSKKSLQFNTPNNETKPTFSQNIRRSSHKCTVSKSKVMESTDSDSSINLKHRKRRKRKNIEQEKDIAKDETTSGADSSDNHSELENGTLWRKLARRQTKSSFSLPENSSPESSNSQNHKRKISIEANGKRVNSSGKRNKKSSQQQDQEDFSNEDDDRSCSSTSPQPIGDRLPILKSSIRDQDLFINMGGEPDTVNMGGEPDDDEVDHAADGRPFSGLGLSSYRAPVLISHPIEADIELEEEPPAVEHQQNHIEQFMRDDNSHLCKMQSVQKGVENMNIASAHQHQTLKIPSIHLDSRKSCSPSDTATVEMPALDAAEKHVSPEAGGSSRFGEGDQVPVDDDAPPMLSPQAANVPTPIFNNNNSNNNNESFKIGERSEEDRTSSTNGEQQKHHNISSSSVANIEGGTTEKMREDNVRIEASSDENAESRRMEKQTHAGGRDQSGTEMQMDQLIAVTSHDLSNRSIPPNQANIPSITSPTFISTQKQSEAQQSQQPNFSKMQPIETLSALYDQQNCGIRPPKIHADSFSSQQQHKVAEKSSEKGKYNKEKSTSSKSASPGKNKQKGNITKAVPVPSVARPVFSSSMPSTSQTSVTFPQQWFNAQQVAQQFAQYYQQQQNQQQYYGGGSSRQAQTDLMSAAQMGYFYSYNQQWQHAWSTGKFPAAALSGASAYPSSYEEWMAMMGASGATAAMAMNANGIAPSSYQWSSAVSTASQQPPPTFYPPPHPPM